ncbi:MAG: RNA polymerase sigma factor, partial [Victivallales bacterium]|nr:RNA polymerase sigma factor [Victivallales bacterium]
MDGQIGSDDLEDRKLVCRVLAGDMDKFEDLIARHQQRVYNCAYGITRNSADAADVTQDTFIRFYRNISQFDPERPLRPYLIKITV